MGIRKIITLSILLIWSVGVYAQYYEEQVTSSTFIPNTIQDASAEAFGIDNAMIENDYNMFFNPAEIMNYGTVYIDTYLAPSAIQPTILQTNGKLLNPATRAWVGATLNIASFKIGAFLERPYTGYATAYITPPSSVNGITEDTTNIIATNNFGLPAAGILGITGAPSPTNVNLGSPLTPTNQVDILIGTKLGGISAGIKITLADNSFYTNHDYKSQPTAANDGNVEIGKTVADHHITLGILLKNIGPISSLGVSCDLGLMSMENYLKEKRYNDNATAEIVLTSDNAPAIGVLIRPIVKLGNGKLIVPVNFNLIDTSTITTIKEDRNGDGDYADANESDYELTLQDKRTFLGINMAYHTKPAEKLKVIYAIGFDLFTRTITATATTTNLDTSIFGLNSDSKIEEESEETTIYIPLALSFEHQTLSWLATRFSIQKNFILKNKINATDKDYIGNQLQSTETAEKSMPYAGNSLTISGGLGIKPMDKMSIDVVLAAGLVQMPDFDDNVLPIPLVSRIALKYHF